MTDTNDDPDLSNDNKPTFTQEELDAILATRLEESLKDSKAKLEASFIERDKTKKRLEELERKEREANLKLLEEQGKFKEIFEMQLKEKDERLSLAEEEKTNLKRTNDELNRDILVRSSLSGINFRNEKAANMAFSEITRELIQDANNQWVHKSGIILSDFIKTYIEDEANSFLLKQKQSSGAGDTGGQNPGGQNSDTGSLFGKSQQEVLKMAAEGKLRKNR